VKWVLTDIDEKQVAALSDRTGLHPLVARLMCNRGITDPADAREFLECDLSLLSDPAVFRDMDRAVMRIRKALSAKEKIVLYGDYDVDGVTGTALLFLVLKRIGAHVAYYIPDRVSEGYGLNSEAIEKIKAAGAGLVITIDCGISAIDEARMSRSLGLDLILTDHHEFNRLNGLDGVNDSNDISRHDYIIPEAYAILHPLLLAADVSPAAADRLSGLTGVGVAFKLAQALLDLSADDEDMARYLDLVVLGTVADVGKISGENRILVKHGLERLSAERHRPGIAALKQVSGLNGKKISVGTVGFTLAPRINASGRLDRADLAFRLLTTESREEAESLASALEELNTERRSVQEGIWQEARRFCLGKDLTSIGAFVLSSKDWHPGVIGIVASRIAEEFYRPTALICVKDGVGKGSARSVPGINLYEGFARCSDLLLGFGGHKYAAGFTVAEDKIDLLRDRLSTIAREAAGSQGFVRTISLDGSVELEILTIDLVREIEKLSPFGQGNPEPKLGARGLKVVTSRIVGKNHLRLKLKSRGGQALDAIAFKQGNLHAGKINDGSRLAAVFTPRLNAWNGNTAVELDIKDIKVDK
jgi:single-stranded-DNA-specific exonuclease